MPLISTTILEGVWLEAPLLYVCLLRPLSSIHPVDHVDSDKEEVSGPPKEIVNGAFWPLCFCVVLLFSCCVLYMRRYLHVVNRGERT